MTRLTIVNTLLPPHTLLIICTRRKIKAEKVCKKSFLLEIITIHVIDQPNPMKESGDYVVWRQSKKTNCYRELFYAGYARLIQSFFTNEMVACQKQ